ncbi:MAG: hypothetical protein ACFFD9_01155 [Candidatus Thorarchaeota archaeon]
MIDEEPLARLIRLRRYDELDTVVDETIREDGWSEVVSELRRIPTPTTQDVSKLDRLITSPRSGYQKSSQPPPPYYITEQVLALRHWLFSSEDIGWGVRRGTLRDGIVHILGLQTAQGIELDNLERFEGIQASSLDELRQGIIPVALDVLRSQTAEPRTFFLDVDAMSISPFAPTVPYIVEARKREIQDLSDESEAGEVLRTYYGFRILTDGSMHNTSAPGFADSSLKALDDLVQVWSGNTRLMQKKFEAWRRSSWAIKRETWNGFDDLTKVLLEAIVFVSTGSRKWGIPEGLSAIGALGDSRALPTLHRLLELIPARSDRLHMVLEAIGKIGHPSSFDHILPLAKKDTVAGDKALEQMALIRSLRATNHLIEVMTDGEIRHWYLVARRFWMTFDCLAVETLHNASKRVLELPTSSELGPGDDVIGIARIWSLAKLATISLALIGEEGQAVLRKHPEEVARVILKERLDPERLIETLRGVKGLMDDPVIVKAIQELET